MSGPETTTEQKITFGPEALQILQAEVMEQFGLLNPVQQQQLFKFAQQATGQPNFMQMQQPAPGIFAPAEASARQAAPQMGVTDFGPMIQLLQGGQQKIGMQQGKQAREINASVSSFLDPRYANMVSPKTSSTASTGVDEFATGAQAAAAAAAIATAAAALIVA